VAQSIRGRRAYLMCSAAIAALGLFNLDARADIKSTFEIPAQPLPQALTQFGAQSGAEIVADSNLTFKKKSRGAHGVDNPLVALQQLLAGTGLTFQHSDDQYLIVAANTPRPAAAVSGIETVTVTAQRVHEDIQNVPIAVSAFSQKQLTDRQIATGGDLIRETPNMNFGKTNFSGYSIELRGIGTQAISVTTDPAVAVAFNGIPFIRNHFFEQEFYDVSSVEVLRGPQGTLWGRNATAGVVNLMSAKPTDSYEAMVSVDIGNYLNRRLEGMINIPIVGDKLDIRAAGEWTMRDGYSFNALKNSPIDGRDLWSGRVSVLWRPIADLEANLVWEHFSEDDDRMRTSKQLCETDPIPAEVGGVPVPPGGEPNAYSPGHYLSQGCRAASLYSSASFEVPNGLSLPYYSPLSTIGTPITGHFGDFDPYASTTQSRNLRVIETQLNPIYKAKNDTIELNVDYTVSPTLNFSSQTGYNQDFLWSTEDYNRFNTAPGAFIYQLPEALGGDPAFNTNPNHLGTLIPDPNGLGLCVGGGPAEGPCVGSGTHTFSPPCKPQAGAYTDPSALDHFACIPMGVFCDPQLGCSDRLVAQDLSEERSWQFSQEFRLASHFDGPLNFSFGGNFLHYETQENYYVFLNTLSLAAYGWANNGQTLPYVPGSPSSNTNCLVGGLQVSNPFSSNQLFTEGGSHCQYIDPNPLTSLNNQGHNYFLSQNPYNLNSYATFGEVYYNLTDDLKLTGGLRWTEDQKHFTLIPSELLVAGYGYPTTGVVDQQWDAITGRAVANWTPKLDFTDQTLIYASYSHGYKAGGANPPGARLLTFGGKTGQTASPIHPLTFKPEYIDAYELGTKNTLLDGTLTLNADIFFYDYKHYQISRIVDRTAINDNFDATVKGAELESTWEPTPGLKFNLAAGVEDTRVADGQSSIDLIDRTAGNPNWVLVKPFVTQASNCILPTYVVAAAIVEGNFVPFACNFAYALGFDPVTELPYVPNPTVDRFGGPVQMVGYPGFDPRTAPNKGEGFAKNLSGNKLPNSPPFTLSIGSQYTIPVWTDWTATLRGDFYWQGNSFARIFNDKPYDQLHGYTNLNLALILNSADGWQVMGYVKNVLDTTALTGDFLNSDDSGLTTNVFLTDPRLYGIRITKRLDEDNGFWGSEWSGADWIKDIFEDADNGKPLVWIEMGGGLDGLDTPEAHFAPSFLSVTPRPAPEKISPLVVERQARYSFSEDVKVSFQPEDSDWIMSVGIRYGHTKVHNHLHQQSYPTHGLTSTINSTERRVLHFSDGEHRGSESHTILDFMAGKDVGLGMFGADSSNFLSLGLRFAQFNANSNTTFSSDPDAHPTFKYFGSNFKRVNGGVYHLNSAALESKRSFRGVGPSIAWSSSDPALGTPDDGELKFDWGLNAALLFGRQRARIHHHTTAQYHNGAYNYGSAGSFRTTLSSTSITHTRSRMVIAPNVGGFAGLSINYRNARVSFGYRADYFFNAMDGGIDKARSENRGFFGPFAHLSIGLGG